MDGVFPYVLPLVGGGPIREHLTPFFAELLDAAPAAIYHTTYDRNADRWTIRYISRGVERILGYKPAELENRLGFRDILLTNEQHYRLFKTLTPDNSSFRLTFEFRDVGGRGRWVSDDGLILFDAEGRLSGSVGVFVDITEQKERENSIQEENLRLKIALRPPVSLGGMVGRSQAMRRIFDRILKMSLSTVHLVLLGESGTGKELAARAIHDLSRRAKGNFVPVNCGSINENLFESAFFGHKKGSFTGAASDHKGFLDSADGGTLFLDEVGEIPLSLQTKLLRVLDGYGYIPVGGAKVLYSDFRLISATNRNLERLIRQGLMREDFYYRINALSLPLPPLRERVEDIPLLINFILARHKLSVDDLPPEVLRRLLAHPWPGNIRELQNVLSRYLIFQEIDFQSAPDQSGAEPAEIAGLDSPWFESTDSREYERRRLTKVLNECAWRTETAARRLNCSRATVYRKMNKYGLLKK